MIEYMVIDGCWNLARQLYQIKPSSHRTRIMTLCDKFQIPYKQKLIKKIVTLRNDLFHETLWDDSQPCTTVSSEAYQQPGHLRRLTQRLVPALFGYNNNFVKSEWWSLSSSWFDQQSSKESN